MPRSQAQPRGDVTRLRACLRREIAALRRRSSGWWRSLGDGNHSAVASLNGRTVPASHAPPGRHGRSFLAATSVQRSQHAAFVDEEFADEMRDDPRVDSERMAGRQRNLVSHRPSCTLIAHLAERTAFKVFASSAAWARSVALSPRGACDPAIDQDRMVDTSNHGVATPSPRKATPAGMAVRLLSMTRAACRPALYVLPPAPRISGRLASHRSTR